MDLDEQRRRVIELLRRRYIVELTAKQKQVADLLFQGKTNYEIAKILGIELGTARVHISKVYQLTGKTRLQLIKEPLNGVTIKPPRSQQQNGGNIIHIPEGKKLIDLVRQGMATGAKDTHKAAQFVGISERTYRLVRKLLMLQDRGVLLPADATIVEQALKILNDEMKSAPAEKLVNDVLKRYWEVRTQSGESRERRNITSKNRLRERFDNTIFAIREACSNNEELELPLLTAEQREESIDSLIESIASLWELLGKLRNRRKESAHD